MLNITNKPGELVDTVLQWGRHVALVTINGTTIMLPYLKSSPLIPCDFFLTNNLTQILPESYITEILLSRWNNLFYCNYGSYIDGLVQEWYLHCNVLEMLKCCTSHHFTFTFCWFFCIFYIFFLYFFLHRQTVDLNFDLNSDDDSSPFGPLTQRLVSALIEENIMTPLDDGSIETGK